MLGFWDAGVYCKGILDRMYRIDRIMCPFPEERDKSPSPAARM